MAAGIESNVAGFNNLDPSSHVEGRRTSIRHISNVIQEVVQPLLFSNLFSCFVNSLPKNSCQIYCLSRDLLAEELLERLSIVGELLNTLVQLVECHLILKELPSELGLIVYVGNLCDGLALCSCEDA